MSRAARFFIPVGLALAIGLFGAELFLTPRILGRGDVLLYFYPYWTGAAEALRSGRLPLWNPHLFLGAPFLANSQAGVFYPLNWPLWLVASTPVAVKLSLWLHLTLAAAGAYLAARRALRASQGAAILAGLLFALGGPVLAQAEHVNQIQGLAWMPWFLAALASVSGRGPGWRATASVAVLFCMQLLAGHTQTAFITGVGLGVWLLLQGWQERRGSGPAAWRPLAALGLGALLALPLAACQLVPTVELAGLSSRAGGLALADVLSFSWNPLLATRSLLPGYGQSLFTEYVAALPLTALLLGFHGLVWGWQRRPRATRSLLALLLFGLVMALGRFNPLYWLLGRLPGFDLFRVPARWLAWYGLAAALLAAQGWDSWRSGARPSRRVWLAGSAGLVALMAWGWPAAGLAAWLPLGPEVAPETPSLLTVGGWALELTALWLLWALGRRRPRAALAGLALLLALVVYADGRDLPLTNPTAPAAYAWRRPPAAYLLSQAACRLPERPCLPVPPRFLSLSDIFFDAGDEAELDTAYGDRLSDAAWFDLLVALKQAEILGPNLPLDLGLYAVDGFDGGILPLASYQELAGLLLPAGETAPDGRLRERLAAVPAERWLDLLAVGHVITDKTADAWRRGVYFDRQFPVVVLPEAPVTVAEPDGMPADAIWLLTTSAMGLVDITLEDGRALSLPPRPIEEGLVEVAWQGAAVVRSLALRASADAWTVDALSLVNRSDESFLSLVPGAWRLAQSGDVKLYERVAPPQRVAWIGDWEWAPSHEEAFARLAEPAFDPARQAVLLALPGEAAPRPTFDVAAPGTVEIISFAPERVKLRASGTTPAIVLLKETAYPGWRVFVDGAERPLLTADGLYQAVLVPGGDHTVEFRFMPRSVTWGLALSGMTWLALAAGLLARRLHRRRSESPSV